MRLHCGAKAELQTEVSIARMDHGPIKQMDSLDRCSQDTCFNHHVNFLATRINHSLIPLCFCWASIANAWTTIISPDAVSVPGWMGLTVLLSIKCVGENGSRSSAQPWLCSPGLRSWGKVTLPLGTSFSSSRKWKSRKKSCLRSLFRLKCWEAEVSSPQKQKA